MKHMIVAFILTSFHLASANEPTFEACESVGRIAILNQAKAPFYWAEQGPAQSDISSCYENLKLFATRATPKMVSKLEQEYFGEVRIFNNAKDFEQFVIESAELNSNFSYDIQ